MKCAEPCDFFCNVTCARFSPPPLFPHPPLWPSVDVFVCMEVTNTEFLRQLLKADLANLNTGTLPRTLVSILQLYEMAMLRSDAVPKTRRLASQKRLVPATSELLEWAERHLFPAVPENINVIYSADARVCGPGMTRPIVVSDYRTTDWADGPVGNVSEAHDYFMRAQAQWIFRAEDAATHQLPFIVQHACAPAQDGFQDGANACAAIITEAIDDIVFNVTEFLRKVCARNPGIRYANAMRLDDSLREILSNSIGKIVKRAIVQKAAGTVPGMAPAGSPDDVTALACGRAEPPARKDVELFGNRLKELSDGVYAFTFTPSATPASVGLTVGAGIWTVRAAPDNPVHASDIESRAMCIYDSHDRATDGKGRLYMFWWIQGHNREYIIADYILGVIMGYRWQVTAGMRAAVDDTRDTEDMARKIAEAHRANRDNDPDVMAMQRTLASRAATLGAFNININKLN